MGKKENSENCRTYTIKEFGEQAGLSKNAAYNAVHRGDVPSIKIGGRYLIPRASLDRMFEAEAK